jgi:ligand-binding sensor domain-containing protein
MKKAIFFCILILAAIRVIYSQNSDWVLYNQSNTGINPYGSLTDMAVDPENRKWFSDGKGLICYDDPYWSFYSIEPAGLPGGTYITSLEIDSSGGNWIGSTGGLIYASNGQWTVYNTGNSGLPSNHISCLELSAAGELWIGTYDKGIVRFDGTSWVVYDSLNSGLPANRIWRIETTSTGNVWTIAGRYYNYAVLTYFNGSTWTTYNSSNTGIPGNYAQSMAIDENGTAWFGMIYYASYNRYYGLASFDGTSWSWYYFPNQDIRAYSIAIDSLHGVWIASGIYGALRLEGMNWTIYNPQFVLLNQVMIDNTGSLWFISGGKSGLFSILTSILTFDGQSWIKFDNYNTGLPSNWISCLALNQEGNVLIGSNVYDDQDPIGGGLTFFNGSGWATYNRSNSGLIADWIWCMATEPDGTTWLSAPDWDSDWPLIEFDGDTAIYYYASNSGLPSGVIIDIAIDASGRKWIATGDTVAIFDDTSWQVLEFNNKVYEIERSPEGDMWLAGDGINTFDGTNWWTYDPTVTGTPMNINSIAFAPDGAVWFGNNPYPDPSNLIRFDGTSWQIFTPENSGLPASYIMELAAESDGILWIATASSGAVRFDGATWDVYNQANSGLPTDAINCMLVDGYDNKWFGFYGDDNYGSPAIAVFNENGIITHKPAVNSNHSPAMLLYPNPFTSQVTLKIDLDEVQKASIRILSADGRLIRTINGEVDSGGHLQTIIDVAGLPPGLYFVMVQTPNHFMSAKVLKI